MAASNQLEGAAVGALENKGKDDIDTQDTAGIIQRDGWMALVALCLTSSFNAFMCMNFSATEAASVKALGISKPDAAKLYSYYLFSCMLGMTPTMWLSDKYERLSLNTGVWATVAAAWIRWWALRPGSQSYQLCVLTQILIGYGACPVSTLPGKISHQRFGPGLRALTTSLMVQANYFGWLMGSSVPSVIVEEGSPQSLSSLAWMQAIYSVFIFVAHVILYRPPPPAALAEDAASTGHMAGFVQIVTAMRVNPQFTLQLITHGLLGGIGFAVPSAIFFILDDLGSPSFVAPVANFLFIGTGVCAGIAFGYLCTEEKSYPRILKLCYCLCPVSIIACAVVSYSGFMQGIAQSYALITLLAVAGFATLGFTGIAFEDMALFPAIPAKYVIWIGYMFILGFATPLSNYTANAQGFNLLGFIALGTCAIFSSCYKPGCSYSASSTSLLSQAP